MTSPLPGFNELRWLVAVMGDRRGAPPIVQPACLRMATNLLWAVDLSRPADPTSRRVWPPSSPQNL